MPIILVWIDGFRLNRVEIEREDSSQQTQKTAI